LGAGPGDEVIVPDSTWIASSAPISYVGATPVFADVDPQTWCLSAGAVEECITPKTKGIIAVDLYGSVPDFDALCGVADKHGLWLIEDAAEAVGSEYKGKKAGSFGDTGVFSFHGSKTLTTGEGGLLATDREDLYRRSLVLRDHGRAPGDKMFFNQEVAYKYKMSSMQAALGLAQLERIDELITRKREIFAWYREELQGVPGITLNAEPPGTKNSYWMVTVIFNPALELAKEKVLAALDTEQIDGRPFFHPLSSVPAYRDTAQAQTARARNTVAYQIGPNGVNLPSGLQLHREHVRRVCDVVKRLVAHSRASKA
jgi:perosamine synthetase